MDRLVFRKVQVLLSENEILWLVARYLEGRFPFFLFGNETGKSSRRRLVQNILLTRSRLLCSTPRDCPDRVRERGPTPS
jgi:hypothetical protein